MNTIEKIIFAICLIALGGLLVVKTPTNNLGRENSDTFNTGVTNATTTINTTSTQVATSVTKFVTLINTSASQITCSLDDQGTTVASSSVAAGKGFVIGPAYLTTSSVPTQATFGACESGMYNCYPFTGTLNCLAAAQVTITKVSK